jgi:UPF0716 protein FxsA
MGLLILIAMIGIPIAEIAVFIEVGEKIGLGATLFIVIATALMGTMLLRQQGFSVLARAQTSLQENRLPLQEIFDGLCLLVAGALLLTPGFVTDTVGLLLFVPPFRALIGGWAAKVVIARGNIHVEQPQRHGQYNHSNDTTIIDGEFSDITEPNDDKSSNTSTNQKLPPF